MRLVAAFVFSVLCEASALTAAASFGPPTFEKTTHPCRFRPFKMFVLLCLLFLLLLVVAAAVAAFGASFAAFDVVVAACVSVWCFPVVCAAAFCCFCFC